MLFSTAIKISYLIGALAFVVGLRRLSSPDTAKKGNILAATGMAIAIIASILSPFGEVVSNNYLWIAFGLIVGSIIGLIAARKVKMTDMPQMVSVFNGLGGACAVALAMVELWHYYRGDGVLSNGQLAVILSTLLIGAVAFTGSMLAYLKLDGKVWDSQVSFRGHSYLNIVLLVSVLIFGTYLFWQGQHLGFSWILGFALLALIYGFSFVAPIGGADMPVVISLLNSFTGLSAAAAGLIYNNQIMLIGGILVGASGTILTVLMCNAMNRSLLNVIIGGFGGSVAGNQQSDGTQTAKEISANDAAILLYYSDSVMVVPGYGLAVAQAQKVCKELDDLLENNGVEVKYAIHPVAGRMPGHMNVLLAEADVPYPKLLEHEAANAALNNTDVVVVVGANDVVNPSAEDDASSPIYGMPVLQVWKAKNVIVLKRSMRPGYAGIQNPLFFNDNTRMLFGDAKDSLQNLVQQVKEN